MYITARWYQGFYFRLSCKSTMGLFQSQAEGVFGGLQAYKTITTFHVYVYLSAQVSSFATPSCFYSNEAFSSHHRITPARIWSYHCHYAYLLDSAIFKKCIISRFTVSFQRNAKVGAITCQVSLAGMTVPLPGAASNKKKKIQQNIRESFVWHFFMAACNKKCN